MVIAAKLLDDSEYALFGRERSIVHPVGKGTGKVKVTVIELTALAKFDVWVRIGVLMAEASKLGIPP